MERSMSERIEEMISEEKVNARICELGAQISKDYAGEKVHLICILKGASFFACELAKRITIPVTIDFMSVSSYGGSTTSTGVVKIVKDLDEPIADENVIVVEDIVDTGLSLKYIKSLLLERRPQSLAICVLLDKPDRRKETVKVEYTGFTIPDEFVIGYGLDYAGMFRHLPAVFIAEPVA